MRRDFFMSDKINSFIDDDEYEYEEIDEVLFEEEQQEEEQEIVSEALKRIEQAKLYESLLKHNFFAAGSARPEIQNKVTSEIRGFILERLNVLLGMKSPIDPKVSRNIELPFSKEQLQALVAIADRLISKGTNTPHSMSNPVVNQFSNREPEVIPHQTRPTEPILNQPPARQEQSSAIAAKPRKVIRKIKKKKLDEDEIQGEYRPQKLNPDRIPMASPMQEAQKYATEVESHMRSGGGGSQELLNLAIGASRARNKDVIED